MSDLYVEMIINKINNSTITIEPYPHIKIDNFLEETFKNNIILPDYDDIDDNVYFQDSKKSKKSIVDNSKDNSNYLKLLKNNEHFKMFNDIFKNDNRIFDTLIQKFGEHLSKNLSINIDDANISTSLNYSVSIPGYLKEIHVDRREHLLNILYYLNDCDDSAQLELWKEKNVKEANDVFPKRSDMIISKNYYIKQNSAIIMINLPWSYHSVSIQSEQFLNRKYIYVVWDYEKNSRVINDKNNESVIWKKKVYVEDETRRNNFLNNEKNK